jgi:hypothetical protein
MIKFLITTEYDWGISTKSNGDDDSNIDTETLFSLLGESGVNLLVMLGITPNTIDGLQISGLPKKVIQAKLRAMIAAGLIQEKGKDNTFFLTNQGEIAFKSLLKLFEF